MPTLHNENPEPFFDAFQFYGCDFVEYSKNILLSPSFTDIFRKLNQFVLPMSTLSKKIYMGSKMFYACVLFIIMTLCIMTS